MKAWSVSLESDVPFTVYVLKGDAEDETRAWVCARSDANHRKVAWLGVWSRSGCPGRSDVMEVLGRLAESVKNGVKTGPFGPILEHRIFLPSWDTWGGGRPRAIMSFRPWEVAVPGLEEVGLDTLDYPGGGIEI